MKKKRLSVFSLLIALTLTLGACDDLEDLFPSGSDSDESTELTEDEDPNTGVNPNEDEDENEEENNDDNDDEEKGDEPVNKDVTITLNPTSISLKENETEYFIVSLSDSEASILTVSPENATYIEVGPSGSDSEYYVKGLAAGSTSITITAGGEGFNTATATLPVTVTPGDVYTYELVVANENQIPTTGWYYNSEDTFTFEPQLKVFNRGELEDTITLTAGDAEIAVSNAEETADDIITIDGLTISPKGASGTVVVNVSYVGSITEAVGEFKSYTVTVDDIITSTHSITLAENCVPSEITVGDTGFDISATLITETTTGSTGEVATSSVDAQASDLSISCNPSDAFTVIGLHLVPKAVTEDTEVTITVVWSDYSEESSAVATASTTIHPKGEAVYSMAITNESAFSNWYVGDEPITLEYVVTSSEDTGNPVSVDASEISVIISDDGAGVVTKDGLTLTPVGKGSASVFIQWTTHTEANATLEITVGEHWYTLTITNTEEFSADWSIEDGARTLAITLNSDRNDVETSVSESTVKLDYDEGAFTVSAVSGGFSITPTLTAAAIGECVITATWIGHDSATQSITVNVNNNIAVATLTLDKTEINLENTDDSETLVATLFGSDGYSTPTNTEVIWESNNTNVVVTPDTEDSRNAVVTALDYSQEATITATAAGNSNAVASCTVTVAAPAPVPAKVVEETLTPTTISSPDDHGVYVLGDSVGSSYVSYSSGFSVTTDYDEAVEIKTIASETSGEYYLQVGDKYISSNLQAEDSTPTTIFTVSDSGITMSGSTVYIGSAGLTTTAGSAAYLLDVSFVETTTTTTEGEYYLHGSKSGQECFYNGSADSSNRLSTSADMSDAVKVTLTHVSGNAYYMKYGSTWIAVDSSSAKATATSATLIYYDATHDAWCDANQTKYLGANSSTSGATTSYFFGSYQYSSGNLNGSYEAVTLYDSDDIPEVKGIGITLEDISIEVGKSTTASLKTYPSAAHALEFSDLTFTCTGSGTASFNSDTHLISGEVEGTATLTFTNGSVSDSYEIEITENTSGVKTLTFTHTFVSGDLGATGTAVNNDGGGTSTFGGLTWTYSNTGYKSWSSSDGIHLGSGSYDCVESDPFTFSASFEESVTLTSVTLEMKTAASTKAGYYVNIGDTKAASATINANTTFAEYTTSNLSVAGDSITIAVWSGSSKKAVYIKSFSFTIVVDASSTLTF